MNKLSPLTLPDMGVSGAYSVRGTVLATSDMFIVVLMQPARYRTNLNVLIWMLAIGGSQKHFIDLPRNLFLIAFDGRYRSGLITSFGGSASVSATQNVLSWAWDKSAKTDPFVMTDHVSNRIKGGTGRACDTPSIKQPFSRMTWFNTTAHTQLSIETGWRRVTGWRIGGWDWMDLTVSWTVCLVRK